MRNKENLDTHIKNNTVNVKVPQLEEDTIRIHSHNINNMSLYTT